MTPLPVFEFLLVIAFPLFLVGGTVAIHLISTGAISAPRGFILLGVAAVLMTLLGFRVIVSNINDTVEANILTAFVGVIGFSIAIGFFIGGLVSHQRRRRQRWIDSESLEDIRSRQCPNCDVPLDTGHNECLDCGWSPTNDKAQKTD